MDESESGEKVRLVGFGFEQDEPFAFAATDCDPNAVPAVDCPLKWILKRGMIVGTIRLATIPKAGKSSALRARSPPAFEGAPGSKNRF